MFKSLHTRARAVATVGVAAALAVAGVAFAQGGGGNGSQGNNHRKARSGKPMPPPPGGPFGKAGKDLTYAELHVQRNGEAEVVRIDRGEIVSVDDSSITLKENDSNEVTTSIDENTKVLAGPGKTEVSDLETGQTVLVAGPEGGTAKAVIVPPKRGQKPHGAASGQRHGNMPPPGAPFGGQQGGPPADQQGGPSAGNTGA